MLTFYFTGVEGKMTVPELLTSGMMGKELRLEFSEEWESLTKTVVFSNGETILDRLYTGETMVIPTQILEKPLAQLTVGLYGVSEDGLLVIPTIRANGPVILPGVDPSGDPGVDPSLPVWAQLQAMIDQLGRMAEEEKKNLTAALEELSGRMKQSPVLDYYGSLAFAISDINNGVNTNALAAPDGAKTVVFTAHTGAKTVMLLADVSESTALVINKDIDLVLNGKVLSLTAPTAELNFAAGTNCRIYGDVPGSAIVKECNCTSATANPRTIYSLANKLEVYGGSFVMKTQSTRNMAVFNIAIGANEVLLDGCTISAENPIASTKAVRGLQSDAKHAVVRNCSITAKGGAAQGIMAYTNADVENCVIRTSSDAKDARGIVLAETAELNLSDSDIHAVATAANSSAVSMSGTPVVRAKNTKLTADAPGCHATDPANSSGVTTSRGSKTFLENCTVFGTHSGVSSLGELYVNGGTYTGFCHGGFYVSGTAASVGKAYINDATIRCGNYEGQFDYSGKNGEIYGSFYIGGSADSNNNTAYLDGCAITGEGQHPIVMRGTDGEHDNTIYISNSTVFGIIRIDNDTLKLMVGEGTNITNIKIDTPSRAAFTRKLYRRNDGEKILSGSDYEALVNRMEGAAGLVKSVGGVAADQNGNVPVEWLATKTFQPGVILEETTITGGFVSAFSYESMEGQEEVAVLCDGRLYLCTPEFGYSQGDGHYVHLGNKYLMSKLQTDDTGEPFFFLGYRGVETQMAFFSQSGEHVMSISGYVYVYDKMPAEYLPVDAIREIVAAVLAEG